MISSLELNGKLGRVESVLGNSGVDEDFLSVNEFLGDHTRPSKHRKTSVLEFFGVEGVELIRVFGGESQRIETDITGEVIFLEDTAGSEDITGGVPSLDGTVEFEGTDDDGQDFEESGGDGTDFVEVTDGGANILVVGLEERVELDGFLGNEHTEGTEHGNTSVLEFGLTVLLDGLEVLSFGESERIEVSDGVEGTGESVAEGVGVRDEGGCELLGSEGRNGGGSGEKGGGGDREVHFDVFI